jgi:hypothetical protein
MLTILLDTMRDHLPPPRPAPGKLALRQQINVLRRANPRLELRLRDYRFWVIQMRDGWGFAQAHRRETAAGAGS